MTTLRYLERIAPHGGDNYFSIHHKIKLGNGQTAFPGHAHKDLSHAAQDAHYWASKGCDVYLAMCGELNTKKQRAGSKEPYPAADRTHLNAICAKNFYLDVDVKPQDEAAYQSTEQALEATNRFILDANLPNPTFVVLSGTGGFHVYWTLDKATTVTEWRPLANALANATRKHNLKCDAQCTVDVTRILRVSDTWNFKQDPPLPVTTHWDSDTNITLDEMRAALVPYVGAQRIGNTPKSVLGGQSILFKGMEGDLGAGIEAYPPSDIDEVAKHCPFVNDTLKTGGGGYAEPLWKYSISLAARCTDPEQTANRLSCGHEDYSPDETKDKLIQAQEANANNPQLGPPGCEAIQYAGATQCAACPHLALRSNPLNVGFKRNGHVYNLSSIPNDDLPEGYFRSIAGRICTTSAPDDKGATHTICVFPFPILYNSAFAEGHKDKSYKVCFDTLEGGASLKRIEVDYGAATEKFALARSLAGQGLIFNIAKPTIDFMTAFLTQLRDTKTTLVSIPPVGWYADDGVMGFSYDGVYYTPKSAYRCHKMPPGGQEYTMLGDEQPWRDLAKIVIDPARPDLCVLVATAFAGPLVALSGQKGFLLGCWSSKSGVYKTTALSLAQAVWGGISGMQGMTDTLNFIYSKIAILKNLTMIYDELKGKRQIDQFVELTHQLTHGREKGRAGRDGSARIAKEWNTMIGYAVNAPLAQAVQEASKGTDASLFRMFEYQAINPTGKSLYSTAMVAAMTHKLESNYGRIGQQYAKFLGENYATVHARLTLMQEHLQKTLPHEPDQRFWIAAMACIMTGASFAKALGLADFPLPEMLSFLVKEYHRMRTGKMAISQDYTHHVVAGAELATFLRHKQPKNTVHTDILWTAQGRPPKNAVKLLNDGPGMAREIMEVQVSRSPNTVIRIVDSAFTKWCGEHNIPKLALLEAMKDHYGASMSMGRIGSGTKYSSMTIEPVWTICVAGTPLEREIELPE